MSLRGAILGFLSLEPTTGYTLKLRFEGSVRSFWSATQSQIYRELHALEGDGLVSATSVPGEGKPDKKVYALTKAGRAELARWLEEPLDPLVLRHPLLLKLVFASELEPAKLDNVLARYEDELAATRAEIAARLAEPRIFSLARSKREADIWRLSIEHGLAWCDTELAWLSRARSTLGKSAGKGGKKWNRKGT
jgi:PadR family transcriptional regulator AphA